jgi:hypothetical protein
MRKLGHLASWGVAFGLVLPSAALADDQEIIERIYRHVSTFEERYPVSVARRKMLVREIDPRSGEVRKTSTSLQEIRTRVGEAPKIVILECQIDGQDAEPRNCKRRENNREPLYRIFGPNGRDHYRLELLASEAPSAVYRLRVLPLAKTERHFEGVLAFDAESLRLLSSRGSLADYPFGLKAFDLRIDFDEWEGKPVVATTHLEMTLYVPLILNRQVISQSVAFDQRVLAE